MKRLDVKMCFCMKVVRRVRDGERERVNRRERERGGGGLQKEKGEI